MRDIPQSFKTIYKMSNDKAYSYSFSICHNVADGLGFFTLTNRDEMCKTLADAVALADKFNEATGSQAYRATITKHYPQGGFNSGIVYKVIGVSPDGQPHSNLTYSEFPILWITEAEHDVLDENNLKFKLAADRGASYFVYTPEKGKSVHEELMKKIAESKAKDNNAA